MWSDPKKDTVYKEITQKHHITSAVEKYKELGRKEKKVHNRKNKKEEEEEKYIRRKCWKKYNS
jgi:hypothetical protein